MNEDSRIGSLALSCPRYGGDCAHENLNHPGRFRATPASGGDIYGASVTLGDGTTTMLASGVSHPQAYRPCVRHYRRPLESLP
jgi:hypothetical protein